MSEYENAHDDLPRFEPWLGVMASSVIPPVVALFLPRPTVVPLIIAAVALFLAGVIMLRRQTVQRRRRQGQTLPGPGSLARPIEAEPVQTQGTEPTTHVELEAR